MMKSIVFAGCGVAFGVGFAYLCASLGVPFLVYLGLLVVGCGILGHVATQAEQIEKEAAAEKAAAAEAKAAAAGQALNDALLTIAHKEREEARAPRAARPVPISPAIGTAAEERIASRQAFKRHAGDDR